MSLGDWLGDDPARIVRRSRYWRLNWWLAGVAVLGLVVVQVVALAVVGPLLPSGGGRVGSSVRLVVMVVLMGSGPVAVLMAWRVVGRERRREHHAMLQRLAADLGLEYGCRTTSTLYDRFAWSLTGEWAGRAMKMARVPPSLIGAGGRFFGAVVLSVPCEAPGALSAFIGRRRDIEGAPPASLPQPHLASLGIWAGEDELDAEPLGGLAALGLLATDGLEQAGIEIKEGRARLYYDLGSPVLDFHPPFVRRALDALVELATSIEG